MLFNLRPTHGFVVFASSLLFGAVVSSHAGAALPPECRRAKCNDAAWVTLCNGAETCRAIDQLKALPITSSVPGFTPPAVGKPSETTTFKRLGPRLKMRRKPQGAAAPVFNALPVAPAAAALLRSDWQLGPNAPPLREFDRRAVVALPGRSTGSDTMKWLDPILNRMLALQALEDANAPQRAREDAAMQNIHPAWVGDPRRINYREKNPLWAVTSCEDYAYKKNFDGIWFVESASALGADYRAIYDMATRPDSAVCVANKVPLWNRGPAVAPVRGTGTVQLWTFGPVPEHFQFDGDSIVEFPGNVFRPSFATPGTPQAYTFPYPQTVQRMWENEATMEAAHRAITDEEFDDIERRMGHYSDLLGQLDGMESRFQDAECRLIGKVWGDGLCQTPGAPSRRGGPPAPVKQKANPNAPRPPIAQTQRQSPRFGPNLATSAVGRAQAAATALQHLAAFAQNNPGLNLSIAAANPSTVCGGFVNPPSTTAPADCSKLPQGKPRRYCGFAHAVSLVLDDIFAALAFENSLPDKGCCNPDPIANKCNWSYKKFAEIVVGQASYGISADGDLQRCRTKIPDFRVLRDTAMQNALADKHVLYIADVGLDYSSDVTKVDAYIQALADAAGKWATYEADRKVYLADVAALVAQTRDIPSVGANALGQTEGDGVDVGHPETFSAGAHYGVTWAITAKQAGLPSYSARQCGNPRSPCGVETRVCRYNGNMSASADASASVFGSGQSILNAAFAAYAEDDAQHGGSGAHLDAHFTLLGHEYADQAVLTGTGPPDGYGVNQSSSPSFNIVRPVVDQSAQVPNPALEVGFMIGPVPVTVSAAMTIGAGVDLATSGNVDDACARPGAAPQFALATTVAPHVKADAFLQAGVDLAVASAGIRGDLNLVTLELPIAVGFQTQGDGVTFDTHGDAKLDALSGRLSLYAEIDYFVGSDTWEQTLFSWGALHAGKRLFGYSEQFPLDALSYRFYPPQPWRSTLLSVPPGLTTLPL